MERTLLNKNKILIQTHHLEFDVTKRINQAILPRQLWEWWIEKSHHVQIHLLLLIFQIDAHGNFLCPCSHLPLPCDFRMALIGDTMTENEFDAFWSHVEHDHHAEYQQIVARCQSMIPKKSKISKVHWHISFCFWGFFMSLFYAISRYSIEVKLSLLLDRLSNRSSSFLLVWKISMSRRVIMTLSTWMLHSLHSCCSLLVQQLVRLSIDVFPFSFRHLSLRKKSGSTVLFSSVLC